VSAWPSRQQPPPPVWEREGGTDFPKRKCVPSERETQRHRHTRERGMHTRERERERDAGERERETRARERERRARDARTRVHTRARERDACARARERERAHTRLNRLPEPSQQHHNVACALFSPVLCPGFANIKSTRLTTLSSSRRLFSLSRASNHCTSSCGISMSVSISM
jgi:hypothetical protein